MIRTMKWIACNVIHLVKAEMDSKSMAASLVRLATTCNPQSTHLNNVKVPALMGTRPTQQPTIEMIVQATVRVAHSRCQKHVLRVKRTMPIHQLTHQVSVSVLEAMPPAQTLWPVMIVM